MADPSLTFKILEEDGRCDFILHLTANRIFDPSLSARWSFRNRASLIKRFQLMEKRVRNPRHSLASVPWPRCFPPYSKGKRENSFFIGSFRVHRKNGFMIAHVLAISSSFEKRPIICQGRGENLESQFTLPSDFFSDVLSTLERMDS